MQRTVDHGDARARSAKVEARVVYGRRLATTTRGSHPCNKSAARRGGSGTTAARPLQARRCHGNCCGAAAARMLEIRDVASIQLHLSAMCGLVEAPFTVQDRFVRK
jgi:hypothetical protein